MKKFRLMIELDLTIHQLIQMIKLRGEVVELTESVFEIPNEKYVERVILFHDGIFWVNYAIYDNFIEKCYWEDLEDFTSINQAKFYYDKLIKLQNNNE